MCRLLILCAVPLTPAFGQTLHHFDFCTITSPRQAYVPFRIIITAKSSTGATVRAFAGTVQLTASGAGGALAVEAFSTLKFTSGQWVGEVSVNGPGTSVTLQVNDLAGHTGPSALFQVDPAGFRVIGSLHRRDKHHRHRQVQGEGEARVHQLRQPRTRHQPRWRSRLRRRSQGECRGAQRSRDQQRLLRIAEHRARVAVVAAQPARVRAAIVQRSVIFSQRIFK